MTSEPEMRGQYERCRNLVYFDPSCEKYGDFVAIEALVGKGLVTDLPPQPTRLGQFGLNHHAMMSMQAHVRATAIIAWVVQRACRAHPE
jgi:hypothetical protein